MKKNLSKVIKFEGRNYRYNEEQALLEWVTFTDVDWDSEDLKEIKLDTPKVVDCVGLGRENAKLDLMAYVEQWHYELEEEIAFERMFI